jgi:hypothetical protein
VNAKGLFDTQLKFSSDSYENWSDFYIGGLYFQLSCRCANLQGGLGGNETIFNSQWGFSSISSNSCCFEEERIGVLEFKVFCILIFRRQLSPKLTPSNV